MAKTMDFELYKDNILNFAKKGIAYSTNCDKISFELDGVLNNIYRNDSEITYERDCDDYFFSLNVNATKHHCSYLLKEINQFVDIIVEDAYFQSNDSMLEINYQLESDDFSTTIKIKFR